MNEFEFINSIRAQAEKRRHAPELLRGIGDDAAVLRQFTGRDSVITSDLLVEDIDFRRNVIPPKMLGHKALAVSLSDIAAMGARPRWALLSLGIPQDVWDSDFVDELYEGYFALADRYDLRLIGGDISRTPEKVIVDSILMGECASSHSIRRSGARPGDQLFVTGSLGGSAAGMRLAERGARIEKQQSSGAGEDENGDSIAQLLLRHFRPEARVGWGVVLGEEQLASAMIDISDGLSSDVHHLCSESKVGATIQTADLPLDPNVAGLCGRRALDPLMLALHGGEDFELLFTVAPENVSKLPAKVDGISLNRVGEIRDSAAGVQVLEGSHSWPLEPGGWEHFR